ncbi:MAG TPA: phospholipase C, phosphocholine-specific [Gemmataceae bacterium]|jgi:phospholipase C
MHTRREFLERAARMIGAAGLAGGVSESIQRAAAIEPAAGSTVLDAEHVVILMQENRSFDHAYGSLRGVRGFDDPRAVTLPDGNPVWVQATAAGQRFAPFRLDIKQSNATWMGSLPHGWTDQVDARNGGRHDGWLPAKRSGHKAYADMPLTLGYYTRADIPFYYALADAFTICDQHFCSTLTGTTPNRLHLWTGTIRERPTAEVPANVRNEEVDYGRWASWPTFPELLEDHGISWKVYQNELTIESGLGEDEDAWLSNFSDNPLEFFTQFHARLSGPHRRFVARRIRELPGEIADLRRTQAGGGSWTADLKKRSAELSAALERYEAEQREFTQERYDRLTPREKRLHELAFCTNTGDPAYRQLAELAYRDGGTARKLAVPKGDVLDQFRKDVAVGALPTVSWLVSPEAFSDHPSSAWFGAWYLAEVLDILTRNPAVWKKTVFILTYDENDGYFDHVPPFVAPHPRRPETGRVTAGIDAAVEYVELEQDLKRKPRAEARESPIGLGYRVPLVIASPWTRGGRVCSQVFDHTSVLQFLERLLTHRTGKKVEEPNITRWRRAVCGDLTSAFRPAAEDAAGPLQFPPRDEFIEGIHKAKFKPPPTGFRPLTGAELEQVRRDPRSSPLLPRQEPGVRPACPLPYQLVVDGALAADRTRFAVRFEAKTDLFRDRSAGAPFIAYAFIGPVAVAVRNYAVGPGQRLDDSWPVAEFAGGRYHLRVDGPNGFYREFRGGGDDPAVELELAYTASAAGGLTGGVEVVAVNRDGGRSYGVELRDHAYGIGPQTRSLPPGGRAVLAVDTARSFGWYDLGVRIAGHSGFEKRYAGRVETGRPSFSDPQLGRSSM